jgi:hypothetical protein
MAEQIHNAMYIRVQAVREGLIAAETSLGERPAVGAGATRAEAVHNLAKAILRYDGHCTFENAEHEYVENLLDGEGRPAIGCLHCPSIKPRTP